MGEEQNIKSTVFSGMLWKLAERMGAQMVTMVVSIILARLLMPTDFGAVAILNVFITIAHVFVISGFGSALIQKKDADNADFSSVFYFNIIFSIFVYCLFFVGASWVAGFYEMPILEPTMRVLSLRIPLSAIDVVLHAYVSRNMLFRKFFFATLSGTIVSALIGIIMAYEGFGIWALVWQQLFNTVVASASLWIMVRWKPVFVFFPSRMKYLFSYGWKLLCSGMLDVVYQELTNLVIGKAYTAQDLAYYSNGNKYIRTVITNVNNSISFVLFPAMARYQDDLERVRIMTRRTLKTTSYIIFPILTGLIIVAEPVVELLMTAKWLPSVPYMQIGCVMLAFYPIQTANMEALKAIGLSGPFLKLEITKKLIGVVAIIAAVRYGVMIVALSTVFTMAVSTVINSIAVRHFLHYQYREQITDILPTFLLSAIMGGFTFMAGFFPVSSDILRSLIQCLTGVIVYGALSIAFRVESFFYLKDTLLEMPLKKRKK